jgi:hypothetical protein
MVVESLRESRIGAALSNRKLVENVVHAAILGAVVAAAFGFTAWISVRLAGGHALVVVDLLPTAAIAGAVIGSFIGLARDPIDAKAVGAPSRDSYERRQTLEKSLSDIEREIDARKRVLDQLGRDAEVQRQLLSVERDEAQAIALVLRSEIDRSNRNARRDQIILGVIFFALGVLATILLQ